MGQSKGADLRFSYYSFLYLASLIFPYKAMIWNSNCQTQFFPAKTTKFTGDQAEFACACSSEAATKTDCIRGQLRQINVSWAEALMLKTEFRMILSQVIHPYKDNRLHK